MIFPMVFIPMIVGMTTQIIKFILIVNSRKKFKWNYIFEHGHMPSAHTAFVISLITVIGFYKGIDSAAFAISFVLAYIVIDDAVRFRRDLGRHGKFLNRIIKDSPQFNSKNFPHLKESLGHKISEVIVGGIIGIGFSLFLIQIFNSVNI